MVTDVSVCAGLDEAIQDRFQPSALKLTDERGEN